MKYRVNRGQELVIGGYIPGPHGFGSLIIGYYQGKDLMYVPPRLRNGFVPASRRHGFEKIRHLNLDHDALRQSAGHPQVTSVNPEAYLREVLSCIADHPINRIEELLPWNLAAELTDSSRRAA